MKGSFFIEFHFELITYLVCHYCTRWHNWWPYTNRDTDTKIWYIRQL